MARRCPPSGSCSWRTAINAIFGVGGPGAEHVLRDWGSSAVYVLVGAIVATRAACVARKRAAWSVFAAGLCLYGLGNVLWSAWIEHLPVVPIPSICDGLWLAFYPMSYLGILGLGYSRTSNRAPAGAWLDGLIAGSGFAAVGAALVFGPVLASASGDLSAVATELAFPIGDLLLAALVVGILSLRSRRPERGWTTLGAGLLLLCTADCLYAGQVAHGASTPTAMVNLAYVAGTAMLGLAAWQPAPSVQGPRAASRSGVVMPAVFTLAAVGLLQYDHVRHLDPFAFALVDITLGAALLRCALAVRDIRDLAEARHQAGTDALTSLPNRRALTGLADAAVARARDAGGGMALMMMDLDNFKELNDTLGHSAGDVLLTMIGPRLRDRLGAGDVIARFGGDEFAIVLEGCGDADTAAAIAQDILVGLRDPFAIGNVFLQITASIGIARFPTDGNDAQELLSRADIAMYQAKRAHRGHDFYSRDRDTNSPERLSIAAELARALERGELEVHFQPKAEVSTRRIVGVEALVRWRRSNGRIVGPLEFVGAAEHAGLSRALTGLVLERTLEQLMAWESEAIAVHAAMNTTVSDLLDLSFPDQVADALSRYGLAPDSLVVEVTESSVLCDPGRISGVLARLRELGVGVSLDDFGTGYSSLSHLMSLPVHELKIDRSFVRKVGERGVGASIVDATINLAQELGMRVVAEGVEDETTWTQLAEMGCDLVQGYALGRPLPAAKLTPRLRAQAGGHPLPVG